MKTWSYINQHSTDEAIDALSAGLKLPYFIGRLLFNRGVTDEEASKAFLSKSVKGIHNPMLMPDMAQATERIKMALDNHEPILIYGDYDVDGVTSTVILYSFLKSVGAEVSYYIPSRLKEGYGINALAVSKLARKGNRLMISVDCGIASVGEVELAQLSGMDVIITDHHTPQGKIPNAVAVLNPKLDNSTYPFKELAGCGVAFKLVLAMALTLDIPAIKVFNRYVPIAAIGTVSDIVSVTDENRIIVSRGIELLKTCPLPGIKALLDISGVSEREFTTTTISFVIAPRINAAGRMGNAEEAVNLLLADTDEEAHEIALRLEECNTERKAIESEILASALLQINALNDMDKRKVIIVSGDNWHEGVIGIVAARILDRFNRTTIVLSKDENGRAKGSGRAITGVNLFEALDFCKDKLIQFGGHAKAAGVTIDVHELEDFDRLINQYVTEHAGNVTETINIEAELDPPEATIQNAVLLRYLEPFGVDNEEPIFSICNATVESITAMGADGKHIRLIINAKGISLNCVGFNCGELATRIRIGDIIDIAFNLQINEYKGTKSLQLRLKDVHTR